MRARLGGAAVVVALVALVAVLVLTAPQEVTVTLAGADTTFLAPSVQRGFNVTAYNDLGFSGPGTESALKALAATGTTHAAFVPTWYQALKNSNDIFADPDKTVTDASLISGLRAAKAAGMSVVVKPHVDVLDGTFRGEIRPDDYDAWFASYTAMLLRYAKIAQAAGAPLFVIGDELTGVQGDTVRWPPLIAKIRQVYKGKLTYAANWDPGYKSVPFWNLMDFVGIDEYHPLKTPTDTPSVEDLVTAWEPIVADLKAAHDETGKPVMLTELGYPSRRGATAMPAVEDTTKPVDQAVQARAYTAAFQVLRKLPYLAGVYWWDWATDTRENEADGGQGTYRPRDKPAAKVISAYSG